MMSSYYHNSIEIKLLVQLVNNNSIIFQVQGSKNIT